MLTRKSLILWAMLSAEGRATIFKGATGITFFSSCMFGMGSLRCVLADMLGYLQVIYIIMVVTRQGISPIIMEDAVTIHSYFPRMTVSWDSGVLAIEQRSGEFIHPVDLFIL